ncbi:MAG: DNA internalization-related competence protein ComEC/Rec2 [Gammaproteobacteria bacterium]
MQSFMLGVILAAAWLNTVAVLPALKFMAGLGVVTSCLYRLLPAWLTRVLLGVCLGGGYIIWAVQHTLLWQLPEALENKPIHITGFIVSLPQIEDATANFEFQLKTVTDDGKVYLLPNPIKIHLSWYHLPTNIQLSPGQYWHYTVRLKRPHTLLNPGGFDYEKWLFAQRLRATGTILNGERAENSSGHFALLRLRQTIQHKIQYVLVREPTQGLVIALIVGIQKGITASQWQIMRATGTNHLMAIAGVHIGFVTGFFYWMAYRAWRCSTRLLLWLPAQQAAAVVALLVAGLYSALAGFALPAQRALWMASLALISVLWCRPWSIWQGLSLAAAGILIMEPLAVFQDSFWLSFSAVFAIIYANSGRLQASEGKWKYTRIQWVISLSLIPISIAIFQQVSVIGFVANILAVPLVGIVVLPLCILGAISVFLFPLGGKLLLMAAAKVLTLIWWMLGELAQLPGAVWQQTMPNSEILLASILGVLILLAPKGWPLRGLGLLWLSPLIFYRPPAPKMNEVWLTVLEVGQGLSAVVRTAHHTLIFDTGPSFGPGQADAGSRVLLPYLQAQHIQRVDTLMISHGDNDHIGGAATLLKNLPVAEIKTSVPEKILPLFSAQYCLAGQSWAWDGVKFEVLYPFKSELGQNNNSSCVLRIISPTGSILLTGDIERAAEQFLLAHQSKSLTATVLVAPHHGSATSSTSDFIQAVSPTWVIFPVGYLNRFHFPDTKVVARYQGIGAHVLDTAQSGAITIKLNQHQAIQVEEQRKIDRKFWRSI